MMRKEYITALYDQYIAAHPEGVQTSDTRAFLTAQIRKRLENEPRNLEQEATNLVNLHLSKLRSSRKDLVRTNIIRIIESFTETEKELDLVALSQVALPTGDKAGIDKTLKYWTVADAQAWLAARRNHKNATLAAYALDEATIGQLEKMMYTSGAFTIGDLIPSKESPRK